LTGLPADGALLIRPDGHIACRFDEADDAPRQLARVMGSLLSLSAFAPA
jgi:hypothetical protein